ncbi:MAG: dephospho-CoA kinase [Akkermansiaceae bacterium]|nr:dephospho-CoA kinase [Akkermansiaceae bacterium]
MKSKLTTIGLTGGIATGKSACCSILLELCPAAVVFDADACVARLYADAEIIEQIGRHFGDEVFNDDRSVNKAWLRSRVFSDANAQHFLEQVFHPRVRKECLALLNVEAKNHATRLFVADIPLLFENGFDFGQSVNLLVATGRKTQIDRLKKRNDWDDVMVEAVLSAQMPIDAKLNLADIVFWNEGPEQVLRNQCHRFLQSLTDIQSI